LRKISPLVTFSYDINREVDISWRRMNSYSKEQLIEAGLDAVVADKILAEREANGLYRAAIDIRSRTGLPLRSFEHLI
jgi:DNA uptake protein ComE-like DNA-binding protein